MGALFLYNSSSSVDEEKVLHYYKQKGLVNYKRFILSDYTLLLFRKQLVDIENYCTNETDSIFCCGSLFYKGYSYSDSLRSLLSDAYKDSISQTELYGNYILIYYNQIDRILKIRVDPAYIKKIYFDRSKNIISTDLLSIFESNPSRYSINHLALLENIVSGMLISPDTYFNEINQLDRINITELHKDFNKIEFTITSQKIKNQILSRSEAIKKANSDLDTYFSRIVKLSSEFGAHLGLTGGFDSRLLLIHAIKHIPDLEVNSFWRENSSEFRNAGLLAEAIPKKLFALKDFNSEKNDVLQRNLTHFGGEIRSENYWSEIFNSKEYCTAIANNKFVGFHGCGGEQYRNAERFRSARFYEYIKYEVIFKNGRSLFLNKTHELNFLQYIAKKVLRILEIEPRRIDLLLHKRYQNEIWNQSNRATRVNLLNQHMLYFAPFTEYQISYAVYDYVEYIGSSLSFQQEMIKHADRKLASVPNNYSFSFIDGESFRMKLTDEIISYIPRVMIHYLNQNFLKRKNYMDSSHTESILENVKNNINNSEMIDWDIIVRNKVLKKNLESFDLFFRYIGEKRC